MNKKSDKTIVLGINENDAVGEFSYRLPCFMCTDKVCIASIKVVEFSRVHNSKAICSRCFPKHPAYGKAPLQLIDEKEKQKAIKMIQDYIWKKKAPAMAG